MVLNLAGWERKDMRIAFQFCTFINVSVVVVVDRHHKGESDGFSD
ncbi:hypothetical protein [Flavobacterium album]|nr:hypothetical protein [Flavobacterium album]